MRMIKDRTNLPRFKAIRTSADPVHEANRTFYDRISKAYDLMCDRSERPARLEGLRLLALERGERVLEVGCGTGSELLDISERVGGSGRVCGLDLSRGMLDVARRKLKRSAGASNVCLTQGDGRHLPFRSRSFDAVYASFTLELFSSSEIAVVLREVGRVLRGGGRLGVVSMATVPPGQSASLAEKTYVWFHRHFPHLVDCRPIDVDRVLSRSRFRPVGRRDMGIWSIPVVAVVARRK